MSEHVTQARQARETLARALGLLQSDPSVPPALMDVAEPVAMAMGALHAIERTAQLGTASEARDQVRRALNMLQHQASLNHPAVIDATEAVATSLGMVFILSRANDAAQAASAQAAPVQAAPAPVAAQPQPQPAPSPIASTIQQPAPVFQPAPVQPAPVFQPAPVQPAPVQPAPTFQPAHTMPLAQPAVQAAAAPAVHQFNDPFATPLAQPAPQPLAPPVPSVAPSVPAVPAAAPSNKVPARPASFASTRFEVALGINSPANFYKGLSGNDVIEHGGIFVATYSKVPPVGTGIALRVLLPGGFEFESAGVVTWVRDSSSGESPGFGARFTQISNDARQLVYRYVRNREPLFYDDL